MTTLQDGGARGTNVADTQAADDHAHAIRTVSRSSSIQVIGADPSDLKKIENQHVEESGDLGPSKDGVTRYGYMSEEEEAFLANFDELKKKKMYRKVDFRLVPMLALLYLFAYIDRSNIGNAKIEGLDVDLGINDERWNLVLSIFFIPYVIFEVPCNAILHRYFRNRPSIWMGGLCIGWGIVMTLHGIVQNFEGLIAARFFLGIPEAGFFPGAILICSYWYPRHMIQTRIALFYTSSATAGAFSGLLAFAIAKMDGIGGLEGWRYIFLLEGAATVLLGMLVPWLLVDSPARSKWLDEDEKRYIILAVQAQDGGSAQQERGHGIDWKALKQVVTDWHLYMFAIQYWSSSVPNYAFTFSLPTIITGMGYSSADAQLLTIPPYTLGAIASYVAGRFADRFKRRYPFIAGPQLITIISVAILFPLAPNIQSNIGPCFFAVMLAHLGIYPLTPGINAWTANSLAGPGKRAMGMAFMIAVGNCGGIIGSYIFLDREAPAYPTGYGVAMGISAAGMISATVLFFTFRHDNKQRERITEDEIRAKYTEEELADLGDRSPLYRYTL